MRMSLIQLNHQGQWKDNSGHCFLIDGRSSTFGFFNDFDWEQGRPMPGYGLLLYAVHVHDPAPKSIPIALKPEIH